MPHASFRRAQASLRRAVSALVCLCALIAVAAAPARADTTYILATATTGGTYYPVGIAMATVTKTRLAPEHGVSLSAISSAGSAENIRLLRENEAQFALLQGIYSAWAYGGEGPLERQGAMADLRSVTAVWSNVEHFIVRARHAETGTMADLAGLQGRSLAIGNRSSGAEQTGRHILTALGLDPDGFSLVYRGYGPSADALANGTVDAVNIPAGIPVSAVTRAFATAGTGLRLLSFTDAELAQVNRAYPLWSREVIPAGTYPNQPEPVASIGHPNVLAVRADVAEEDVYQITRILYENLGLLGSIHAATRSMGPDTALRGLTVPLHPGAARYFREAGIDIPAALLAED